MATNKYELTTEHREQLPAWAAKWTKKIMSTDPMSDADKATARIAVAGLYDAAKLPQPKAIVFVKSPFILRFAGGYAAGVAWMRKNGKKVVGDAKSRASNDILLAVHEAVGLDSVTESRNTVTVDRSKWHVSDNAAHKATAAAIAGKEAAFLLECAQASYAMWNGGNQWGQWCSFVSFFRHVVKIKTIDYSKWSHYETLAEISGPRIIHADFCMISDKPEALAVDEFNRPHSSSGPFCSWRDGSSLYAVHGVRVPASIIETPSSVTVASIAAERNAEVKRVMIERYGLTRYVADAGFRVVDEDMDTAGHPRRLLECDGVLVVELYNSTPDPDGSNRVYHVPVHPDLRPMLADGGLGEPQKKTALNAVASTYGCTGEEYQLDVET